MLFEECKDLESVVLSGNIEGLLARMLFESCKKLTSIVIRQCILNWGLRFSTFRLGRHQAK